MLVQRQIRDQALELTVFVSQLPQFAQLAYPYSGIPSLPDIERLLRHAHFPANVADLLPGLDLPHREQNLFFAMTFSRHPCSSCCLRSEDHIHPQTQLSRCLIFGFWVTLTADSAIRQSAAGVLRSRATRTAARSLSRR